MKSFNGDLLGKRKCTLSWSLGQLSVSPHSFLGMLEPAFRVGTSFRVDLDKRVVGCGKLGVWVPCGGFLCITVLSISD